MKANELMVGDLIKTNSHSWNDETLENKYCKVEMVGQNFLRCTLIDNPERQPYGEGNSFDPIPLTAEILEKNGFICDGESWWYQDFRIVLSTSKGVSLVCGRQKRFEFVHQLQHALRLCGIDKTIEL